MPMPTILHPSRPQNHPWVTSNGANPSTQVLAAPVSVTDAEVSAAITPLSRKVRYTVHMWLRSRQLAQQARRTVKLRRKTAAIALTQVPTSSSSNLWRSSSLDNLLYALKLQTEVEEAEKKHEKTLRGSAGVLKKAKSHGRFFVCEEEDDEEGKHETKINVSVNDKSEEEHKNDASAEQDRTKCKEETTTTLNGEATSDTVISTPAKGPVKETATAVTSDVAARE
jgi:hypothetical protein